MDTQNTEAPENHPAGIAHDMPAGYTLRAPTMADIPAAVVVMNRSTLECAGVADASEGLTARHWGDPDRDLAQDTWVVIAPDGSLAAVAQLHPFPPYVEHEFDLYVDPAHAGRGIDVAVRSAIRARALALSAMHHVPESPYLLTTTYRSDSATAAALQAEGYRPIRLWQRMEIDLPGVELPPPHWPEGLSVRTFDPERDMYALWEMMDAAFTDHWSHVQIAFERWRFHAVDHEPNFDPSLFFLVIDAAHPEQVAAAAMTRLERPGDPAAGHVRELGVRREYRGRGVGLALLLHLFADFQRRGKERVSLGVDSESLTGANRLYLRAGMRPVLDLLYYRQDLGTDLPGE